MVRKNGFFGEQDKKIEEFFKKRSEERKKNFAE